MPEGSAPESSADEATRERVIERTIARRSDPPSTTADVRSSCSSESGSLTPSTRLERLLARCPVAFSSSDVSRRWSPTRLSRDAPTPVVKSREAITTPVQDAAQTRQVPEQRSSALRVASAAPRSPRLECGNRGAHLAVRAESLPRDGLKLN